MSISNTTDSSIFERAKKVLKSELKYSDSSKLSDWCLSLCFYEQEYGDSQSGLDEGVFLSGSSKYPEVNEILGMLGIELEPEEDVDLPKIQLLRVLGDVLLLSQLVRGVSFPTEQRLLMSISGMLIEDIEFESGKKITVNCTMNEAELSEVAKLFDTLKCDIEDTDVVEEDNSEDAKDYLKPYLSFVNNCIDKILAEYTRMFASGYGLRKPKGIMTPEGMYTIKDEHLVFDRTFDEKGNLLNFDYLDIGSYLGEQLGFKASTSSVFDPTDALVSSNYLPQLLLFFARGCTPNSKGIYRRHPEHANNWNRYKVRVIKPYLRDIVFANYIMSMVKAGKSHNEIRSKVDSMLVVLTNCCLVLDWDMTLSIKLRIMNLEKDFSSSDVPEQLFDAIYRSVGEIVARREDGFLEFRLIKDVDRYNKEPLFAFEALDDLLDNGQSPSWSNVVLGRLANDTIFTFDMTKWRGYHVVAASRMGKGVECLNMLASALGSACAVAYLDSKPDMAITVKSICPTAAVCTAEQCTSLGISESSFSSLLPEYAVQAMGSSSYDSYGGIIYGKMLQLLLIVAELRFKTAEGGWNVLSKETLGWNNAESSWVNMVAFVDELEKATVHLNDELIILNQKSYPFKASKQEMQKSASDDGIIQELIESAPAYAKFANSVVKWESSLCRDLNMGGKATFGKANLQMIFIYQSYMQSDESARDHKVEGVFNTLKNLPSTASIIGGDANYYPEAAMKIKELSSVLNKEKRWFSLSTGERSYLAKQTRVTEQLENGKLIPFKPYLLLNSSGISDPCVVEFLNGDSKRKEMYVENGVIKEPRIGFEPYVDYMLQRGGFDTTASDLLGVGASIMNAIVQKLGYSNYQAFIFDMRIESFKTVSAWLELLRTGGNVETPVADAGFGKTLDVSDFDYDESKFSNKLDVGSHGSDSDVARREKLLRDKERLSQAYFPTEEEVYASIMHIVSLNPAKYSSLSEPILKRCAEKIASAVKKSGGIV